MKKIIFLIVATCLIYSGLFAQTAHTEIGSSGTFTKSMVTVSSMNSYDTYAVGIFKDMVYVAQLDNNTPQGLMTSSNRFFNISVQDVILKGGFFDEDDNIVVYGFVSTLNGSNSNINNGIIIKINMSNGLPISVQYSISKVSNTPLTDGCFSRAGTSKTYSFIVDNKYFMRVSATLSVNNPVTIVKSFAGKSPTMMSVSWDADNSKHVISGCATDHNSQFVNFIGTLPGTASIPNTGVFYLYKPTGFSPAEYTNSHVLSGNGYYSDSIAYLVQDLRGNNGDLLWVMQVNYLNGNVVDNVGIRFLPNKVMITDVAHNFDNLFVLGSHIGSGFYNRYLAQINLYDMTNRVVKHSTDYLLGGTGVTTLERNEGYLNNICYNHATSFVQAAGAIANDGYIVEAFDLDYSSCENAEITQLQNVNYTTLSSNNFYGAIQIADIWGNNNLPINSISVSNYAIYSHYMSENCISFDYEDMYLAKREEIESIVREKQDFYSNVEISQKNDVVEERGKIDVFENKTFVCKDFEGTCTFKVYDIYGRLITEGDTFNGNYNDLNVSVPGMYLIKVIDENNNFRTKKVVINE